MDRQLDIDDAVEDDLPTLLELYKHLSSRDPSPALDIAKSRLQAVLAIPNSSILVGKLSGRLVTSCTLFVLPNLTRNARPYALIENVVTDPSDRRKGHGQAILRTATKRAFALDCYKVMLMTGLSDRATMSFYEGAGFEQTKTGFQIRNVPARAK